MCCGNISQFYKLLEVGIAGKPTFGEEHAELTRGKGCKIPLALKNRPVFEEDSGHSIAIAKQLSGFRIDQERSATSCEVFDHGLDE